MATSQGLVLKEAAVMLQFDAETTRSPSGASKSSASLRPSGSILARRIPLDWVSRLRPGAAPYPNSRGSRSPDQDPHRSSSALHRRPPTVQPEAPPAALARS